jgi:hypothetical protein
MTFLPQDGRNRGYLFIENAAVRERFERFSQGGFKGRAAIAEDLGGSRGQRKRAADQIRDRYLMGLGYFDQVLLGESRATELILKINVIAGLNRIV